MYTRSDPQVLCPPGDQSNFFNHSKKDEFQSKTLVRIMVQFVDYFADADKVGSWSSAESFAQMERTFCDNLLAPFATTITVL